MDFKSVKRSHSKKKKIMLYIDESLIDSIEAIKPIEITVQEAIRQICRDFIEDTDAMGGL